MFHARIVSPRGSLYVAAEATPYDLENLRMHVHDLRAAANTDTRVELRIDQPSSIAAYQRVSIFLRQLEAEGVLTSYTWSHWPTTSPQRNAIPRFTGVAGSGSPSCGRPAPTVSAGARPSPGTRTMLHASDDDQNASLGRGGHGAEMPRSPTTVRARTATLRDLGSRNARTLRFAVPTLRLTIPARPRRSILPDGTMDGPTARPLLQTPSNGGRSWISCFLD